MPKFSSTMVLDPLPDVAENGAVAIGSGSITGAAIPAGCGCATQGGSIPHRPVEGNVAKLAKSLWDARRLASDLSMFGEDENVKRIAKKAGAWAHDLELLARELGLVFDLPVQVSPPYLPIDIPPKGGTGRRLDIAKSLFGGGDERALAGFFVATATDDRDALGREEEKERSRRASQGALLAAGLGRRAWHARLHEDGGGGSSFL